MNRKAGRTWRICRDGCVAASLALAVPLALPSAAPFTPTSARAATPARAAAGPTKSQRIKVLTRALSLMHRHYKSLSFSPGAPDIFDYGIGDLWRQGIDGTGTTVALIEGWSDPEIGKVMAQLDKTFSLPKAQITTIFPTGDHRLPATCPPGMVKLGSYGSCSAWAGELELDVLSVHLMAPYAKILLAVAPADSQRTDDAASQVAPPEFMQAIEFVASHHLANVISISDGTGEGTYSHGKPELFAQDPGELAAAAAGIPVLVGTGDCDAAQHLAVGPGTCTARTTTAGRASAAWDDSPWVTAVGGTVPNLTATGKRAGSDPVWNLASDGLAIGEGAGFSAFFGRPSYQNGVASITRSRHRSVPDISLDASDGTSESTPLLGGVLALATQLNHGRNVGPINPVLYTVLGPHGLKDGIADVVSGNNSAVSKGKVVVRGFSAAKGFDVASGWGTIRANSFVPALVRATAAARQDAVVRGQAEAELTGLSRRMTLSAFHVRAGQTTVLTARGFLPLHPVAVFVGGRRITTLHASATGTIRHRISPAALHLRPGRHVIKVTSMLITMVNSFESR